MALTNFNQLVLFWIGLGIIIFFINLRIVAPYGRHVSTKWGYLIKARIGWILMECPVLIFIFYFVLSGSKPSNLVSWALLLVFTAHYFHRIFIFPFRIKEKRKTIPLGIVILAMIFNIVNGSLLGFYLGNFASYDLTWFYSLPFVGGVILFTAGAYINLVSDTMLINLRDANFSGYKIPHGFLFEKISCPNHLGEIMEWAGYALMSFNLPALSFAIWTMANLIPRSMAHHKWYIQQFDQYPKKRMILFPGLW